jgi:hypothetical protein
MKTVRDAWMKADRKRKIKRKIKRTTRKIEAKKIF